MMTSKTIAKVLVLGLVLGSSLALVGCGKKKEKKTTTKAVYAEANTALMAIAPHEDISDEVVVASMEEEK